LTILAARSVLKQNGVGPSKRAVIGESKKPEQTMVTSTP
jgi:hypothetical protein